MASPFDSKPHRKQKKHKQVHLRPAEPAPCIVDAMGNIVDMRIKLDRDWALIKTQPHEATLKIQLHDAQGHPAQGRFWFGVPKFPLGPTDQSGWMIFKDGVPHNDLGPAARRDDGVCFWFKKGALHREDGPARVHVTDGKEHGPGVRWYYEGKVYDEKTHPVNQVQHQAYHMQKAIEQHAKTLIQPDAQKDLEAGAGASQRAKKSVRL